MKIPYSWLKEYVEFDKTPEQLAEDLGCFGFTNESLDKVGDDWVLDLEINPNRGDCLSVLGIAREVAAMYGSKLTADSLRPKIGEEKLDKKIDVTIADPKICPRYSARIIDNIEIKPSPEWIQKKLEEYGFRPINNAVDATNFVMVAMGQPLHAFDYSKIKDGQMSVELSKEGIELMTLDGQNRVLPEGTIIIKDCEKVYDLAGIMGGFSSEVDEKTNTIVLQGAIFNPQIIRRASKKLGHTTDASYRYERGVDFENTISAVDMAAAIIKESCPDAKVGELVDLHEGLYRDTVINLDPRAVNKLLGTEIVIGKMAEYLERLCFKTVVNAEHLSVTVPSYRQFDVKIWQDLAEEVARVFSYEAVKAKMPEKSALKIEGCDWQKRNEIKEILFKLGFTELYSLSFVDETQAKILGFPQGDLIEVKNQLTPETKYLRPSLLPSLLTQIARNPWAPEIAVFEIGKIFKNGKELWQLGIGTVGKSDDTLKAALEKLGASGDISRVDQKILDFYKIRRPVQIAVLSLEGINVAGIKIPTDNSTSKYREVSNFAPTVRDLAFLVDANIKVDEIERLVLDASTDISLVECFDEFSSPKLGENKKNIAFHIWFENLKGPVSEEDVKKTIENIIKKIENKFQAKLRS